MGNKVFKISLLSLLVLAASACSPGGGDGSGIVDDNTNKGMEILGDNVQFDPNKLVNDGEPITIEYWTWNDGDAAIEMAKQYEDIYPNVTINVQIQPWDDYWTKLPLALKGNDGPTIFNIHNSQHNLLIPYLAPYDISIDDLSEDFISVQPHVIDNSVYYIDYLINTGTIFYNKDLWNDAGLTEADIPETWDEFREIAKKLTVKENGRIIQAGFNYNQEYDTMIFGMNYQNGTLMFKEDGETVNFDNETTIRNTQFLVDLYEVDEVGSPDFYDDVSIGFGNGDVAMVYRWGWFQNELLSNYEDIDYGVFATPTFDLEHTFAYDRYNGESTPGINKNQSNDKQDVGQDFLLFLLSNDEYSKLGALAMGSFPAKKSLAEDADILDDPILNVLSTRMERLIWPGAFPSTIENTAKKAMEEIMFNGVSIEDAIKDAQEKIEADMSKLDFRSAEPSYPFFNE